jgi:hypothetical protein
MAKRKPELKGLFARTEPEPGAPAEKRRAIGVYLRQPTYDAAMKIARDENINIHSFIAYAVTYFIRQYQAGKAKIETENQPKPKLDL